MNTTKHRLTRRQEQILEAIRASLRDRGFPPSIREIGEAVGLSSSSTVHSHLRTLERHRYIRRDPAKPRSLVVVEQGPTRVEVLEGLVRDGIQAARNCSLEVIVDWADRAAGAL